MRWLLRLWCVLCTLAACLGIAAAAKPSDRAWKSAQKDCEKLTCGHLVPDEAQNCVNQCLSKSCFDQIYGDEPLEDGEIDTKRARAFTSCVRKEYKSKRSRAAKAADEQQRLESFIQADDD